MKILCVLGQHQYGDPLRGLGHEYATFIPALRRLGHTVLHFESLNKSLYADYSDLNSELLDYIEEEQPDVLIVVPMLYEIWLETLQIIRDTGKVAIICWNTDDSWKYKETSRFIGSSYHAVTTTYPNFIGEYHHDGINNVLFTQWAANVMTLHQPMPARFCRYQVTFIGLAHGDRIRRIAKLRSLGLDVQCFGYGWPSGPIEADEIPKIMNESIISLNFANSKGVNQIKARTFEVPGAGGFLLTEYAPGIENYYLPDKEIVIFEEIEDLVEKANYFLNHFEERDAIAIAGFKRTKVEHTYDIRMKNVVEYALDSRDRWISSSNKQSEVSFDDVLKKHRLTLPLKIIRTLLVLPCILIWGKDRGPRAARRILFEISWRLFGKKTYTSSGLPGRMFYKYS